MMNLCNELTVTPGPSAPFTPPCFFSPPAPPRYFPSRSLRLSRSPTYSPPLSLSPTSGPRLGGAARPPAASLSPLHIAAPHAYSSLLARGWKGGRGGPSSAAPNRALASELAVEEGAAGSALRRRRGLLRRRRCRIRLPGCGGEARRGGSGGG